MCATQPSRVLLAAGLVLMLGGILGLVLPMFPGWVLISIALPLLLIALILQWTGRGNA